MIHKALRSLILVAVLIASVVGTYWNRSNLHPRLSAQTATTPTPTVVSCSRPTNAPYREMVDPGDVEEIPDGAGKTTRFVRIPSLNPRCDPLNYGSGIRAYVEPRPIFKYEYNNQTISEPADIFRTDDPTRRILTDWDCGATIGHTHEIPADYVFISGEVRFYCCNNCPP